jgi:hypothetical protein
MKQEVIKLESRYKDVDSNLIQIEDNKYLLNTNSEYIRLNRAENRTIYSIDLEGGPMISIGDTIQGKKIKSIINKYVIEFE